MVAQINLLSHAQTRVPMDECQNKSDVSRESR